jgi:glycopeptide antibiotics resistance protein
MQDQITKTEAKPINPLRKSLLDLYVLFLLWLILFKTSTDFSSVLLHYQSRSPNLTPFAGLSRSSVREMIDNLVVFIPLGLLLGVNLKETSFRRKITFVFGLSLAAEVLQYVLAIGTTDITDVIMNTSGGLVGLGLYGFISKGVGGKFLDRFLTMIIATLLVLFLYLRFFVFHVKY